MNSQRYKQKFDNVLSLSQFTEAYIILHVKYVQTRDDMNSDSLAFMGVNILLI